MKHSAAHPGFKAVQAKIAAKEGVSKKSAGAILAHASRHASAAAKRHNPRLKRVKGGHKKHHSHHMKHHDGHGKHHAGPHIHGGSHSNFRHPKTMPHHHDAY